MTIQERWKILVKDVYNKNLGSINVAGQLARDAIKEADCQLTSLQAENAHLRNVIMDMMMDRGEKHEIS